MIAPMADDAPAKACAGKPGYGQRIIELTDRVNGRRERPSADRAQNRRKHRTPYIRGEHPKRRTNQQDDSVRPNRGDLPQFQRQHLFTGGTVRRGGGGGGKQGLPQPPIGREPPAKAGAGETVRSIGRVLDEWLAEMAACRDQGGFRPAQQRADQPRGAQRA